MIFKYYSIFYDYMNIDIQYKTVILRLNPSSDQVKELKKSMAGINRFLEMSRIDIQKLLYNRWKELNEPYPGKRSIALMVQRFSNFSQKEFTVFNSDNSKFVYDKEWFLEVQVRTKNDGHLAPRLRIPVNKTEVPYYADIETMIGYPMMVVRENDKWFAYIQMGKEITHSDTIVSVDFNFNKWVASPIDGQPLFFDAKEYGDEIDRLDSTISKFQSYLRQVNDPERVKQLKGEIEDLFARRIAVVKRAHGNFIAGLERKYGRCTLVVEEVDEIFKLRQKDSRMTNNWLYKKTALKQFQLRAMAHGFEIHEVNPAYTSQICHKCHNLGNISGKHGRIFSCDYCGLKDYHRDLNATKNIVSAYLRQEMVYSKHKKWEEYTDEEKKELDAIFPSYKTISEQIKSRKGSK